MGDIKITVVNNQDTHNQNKKNENRVESAQKLIVKVQESEPPKPVQFVVKIKES